MLILRDAILRAKALETRHRGLRVRLVLRHGQDRADGVLVDAQFAARSDADLDAREASRRVVPWDQIGDQMDGLCRAVEMMAAKAVAQRAAEPASGPALAREAQP